MWKKRGVAGAKHVKRRGALNSQKRDVLLLKLFFSWSVFKGNFLLQNSFHEYKLFIQMPVVGPFFHFETCLEAVGRYWGGPEGNYLDWGEKLGSSWIETRKRAPRLKTSCSHRQSRHIRRDRVARFKPRADDTMSPEGHFHIYEFSDQRVWEIYDQCLLLLKKRLTKVTRPTVNLNHLPFQVNEWGPFKHCSFHAMPCVDVKTNWCLRGAHQYQVGHVRGIIAEV